VIWGGRQEEFLKIGIFLESGRLACFVQGRSLRLPNGRACASDAAGVFVLEDSPAGHPLWNCVAHTTWLAISDSGTSIYVDSRTYSELGFQDHRTAK
jgi:hypothetical protein